ncbi:MAG: FKBP-type peptidyl-prolyl cis-trans isomerase [Nannocystaceae bacterium]
MLSVSRTLSLTLLCLAIGCDKPADAPPATAANAGKDGKAYDTKAPSPDAANAATATKTPPKPAKPKGKQVPPPETVTAPPADAKKTASGLAYKVLEPAPADAGDPVGPNDSVKVEYTGWTTDGVTFDTTQGRAATTFKVSQVIPGWTEGMQLMHKGEKMRFWIPEELAYKGRKGRPQGMLVFDVELIEIIAAPKTPKDVAAPPADASKTEGGVSYKVLSKGTGTKHPDKWDKVTVNYTGWTTDGKMFDSSITRGKPATFPLNRVVPGWTEGIPTMVVGEKTRFWIPEELAYKDKPGPQGTLVFDVELISIEDQPEPPPPPKTPEDVAAAPADATKTDSGLAYKVLQPGKGTKKPTKESTVTVHYSGWTTDGKMFDSSITRGKPATFPLGRVIPGWTEGLQLMVAGEKTRFWIPKELAYNDRPGKPAGMLVFDVELIEIDAKPKSPH